MEKLSLFSLIVAAFLLLSACSTDAPLDILPDDNPVVMAKKKHPVPFTADWSTLPTGPPSVGRCTSTIYPVYFTLNQAGTGTASHMGNISMLISSCIAPPGTFPPGVAALDALFTFIAANGDSLHFEAPVSYAMPTAVPLVFEGYGDFIITGGSGRFDDATGSGRAFFILDRSAPGIPGINWLEGEIQY